MITVEGSAGTLSTTKDTGFGSYFVLDCSSVSAVSSVVSYL